MWRETAVFEIRDTLKQFQSTPSVWRETDKCEMSAHFSGISIHSLRVEGDIIINSLVLTHFISIHSLRVEGDVVIIVGRASTSISIHSLRVEGDTMKYYSGTSATDFNPLPPCGGRRLPSHRSFQVQHFNPLPPCGGRRFCPNSNALVKSISIHSLRVEGDFPQCQ